MVFFSVNSGYIGCSKMYKMQSYDEYVPGEINGVQSVFS